MYINETKTFPSFENVKNWIFAILKCQKTSKNGKFWVLKIVHVEFKGRIFSKKLVKLYFENCKNWIFAILKIKFTKKGKITLNPTCSFLRSSNLLDPVCRRFIQIQKLPNLFDPVCRHFIRIQRLIRILHGISFGSKIDQLGHGNHQELANRSERLKNALKNNWKF